MCGQRHKDPNYHYRDIFRIAEAYNPQLQTAIFSTWTDNRTKLIGENPPQSGRMKLDYKFDGLELDTTRYPHDDDSDYIKTIDEAVAREAALHPGARTGSVVGLPSIHGRYGPSSRRRRKIL